MRAKTYFKPSNVEDEESDEDKTQKLAIRQDCHMWSEIKPQGKNLLKRSYHSCVIWNTSLYVYGGYEQTLGILNDFHSIPLYSQQEPFQWRDLSSQGQPGPLRNHQAIVYDGKMYIIGGLQRSLVSTGLLWVCDLEKIIWSTLGEVIIDRVKYSLEGHSSVLYEKEGKDPLILTYGGFYATPTGGYSSSVLSYNLITNQWSFLFEDFQKEENSSYPTKRAAAGLALAQDCLFIFGGTNVQLRYDDFWKFDLNLLVWEQIKTEGFCPESRSSPSLQKHPNINGLLLFGGIHDITHEKNDLCIFDLNLNVWKVIEEDNSHNIEEPSSPSQERQQNMGGIKKKTLETNQNNSFINMSHASPKYSNKQFKPFREFNPNLSVSISFIL